jgi:hypothetical protein
VSRCAGMAAGGSTRWLSSDRRMASQRFGFRCASIAAEQPFRILFRLARNVSLFLMFDFCPWRRTNMKKLAFILAAIGAIAIAVPSMATTANAETVVIKRGGHHHHHGARAHIRSDRGLHRGWRHSHARKVVVIKKRHHHHHY